MKNKSLLIFSTLFVALLISLSQGAAAISFELTVFPNEISVCPCSAITPQHVSVSVKNLHHATNSYTFMLTPPAGWSSQIQDSITLASGEEGTLGLFLINTGCTVSPGVYTATVTAKSETTGHQTSEDLSIEVLLCRGAELSVAEKTKGVCFEEQTPVTYEMNIINLGKFEETFQLSASVNWAGFSESEITLDGGETKTFNVVLAPENLPVGMQTVGIQARSTDVGSPNYYTPVTQTLELDVKDCYDFTVELQPKEKDVCFGKTTEYNLIIENKGVKDDSYSIFTPNWITSGESTVSLGAGQKATILVKATPPTSGAQDVEVTVTSAKETALSKKATSAVNSNECRSVAVIVSPSEQTVCGGMLPVSYDVAVKNTGTVETTYTLSADMGELETAQTTLAPGETGTTGLEVDITGLEGTFEITVSAADGDIYDEDKVGLTVENCYSAELTIEPEMQSICPYDSVKYTVTVRNTGKLSDTYTLRYGDEIETIELEPDGSESYELTFLVPFEESGVYVVSAFADSDHVSLTQTAALNVESFESCYGAEMTVDDVIKIKPCTIDVCETTTLEVGLENRGQKTVSYTVTIEAPDWIHMEDTSFELESGEKGTAYVYLSPSFAVEERTYTVKIKAESDYVNLIEIMDVVVTEDVTGEEPGVSLNASTGNITGAVVGGERPLWKTVVVAVIAIIIIIILAVRFILLVRK